MGWPAHLPLVGGGGVSVFKTNKFVLENSLDNLRY